MIGQYSTLDSTMMMMCLEPAVLFHLKTVIDHDRTSSIVLVLFRCGVVVDQRANTAFWSLRDFF